MIAAAASHNCMTLTYMSWLTDLLTTVFKAKFLVLMDNFETTVFILSQIAYTLKCSNCTASLQPPVSLTHSHGPVILPCIFQYYSMDEHHTRYSGSVVHCELSHTIYWSL